MKQRLLVLGSVVLGMVLCAPFSAQAVTITTSPINLWDVFPQNAQGQNGIYMQYRTLGGAVYTNLQEPDSGSNAFHTDGTPWSIPLIARIEYPYIHAHPAAVTQGWYNRDAVIRVKLEDGPGLLHLTGGVRNRDGATVKYYIYEGENNCMNPPIWTGTGQQPGPDSFFDVLIAYHPGDELFFATSAFMNTNDTTDTNDHADWGNIQLTGMIPEPLTMLGLALGLGGIGAYIRRRRMV